MRPVAIGAGVVAVLAVSLATVEREQRQVAPLESFKEAAEIAQRTDIGPIVTDSIRPEGLRYYLGDDLIELGPTEIESLLCEPRQELIYIRHISIPPEDWGIWSPASLDCAAAKPSVHINVPQRRDRTSLDLWIVDPRATRETIENQ